MTTFKAQKGVPLPVDGRTKSGQRVHPILEEGESYFVPLRGYASAMSINSAARAVGARYGYKVTSRLVTEGGVNGLRIWRK